MAKKKDGRLSQNFGEPGHPARVAKDLFAKKHGARSVSAQTRKLWALFGWSRPDFRIEMLQAEKAKKTHELQLIAAQIRTINDELEKLGVKEA